MSSTTLPHVSASRKHVLPLLGALLLVTLWGAVLRIQFLSQPMRYDESFTYNRFVLRGVKTILSDYSFPNNHIFHTLSVFAATKLFGNHPETVRLPAFLAGIFIIPATYLVGAALFNRKSAVIAAALVASSSYLTEYSTNARGYTLVTLFSLLATYVAYSAMRAPNFRPWLWLALLCSLGFWTIPTMLYPFIGIIVWLGLLILRKKDRVLQRRFAAFVALSLLSTAVLYLPVIVSSGLGAITNNDFVKDGSSGGLLPGLAALFFSVVAAWHRDLPLALTAFLLGGLMGAAIGAVTRKADVRALTLTAAMVGGTMLAVALQGAIPPRRALLFLLPYLFLLAAYGIGFLLEKLYAKFSSEWAFSAAAVALAGIAGFFVLRSDSINTSGETGLFREAPQIVEKIREYYKPGDEIKMSVGIGDAMLEYYLRRARVLQPARAASQIFFVMKLDDAASDAEIAVPPVWIETPAGQVEAKYKLLGDYGTAALILAY